MTKKLILKEPKRLNRHDELKRLILMDIKVHDTETDAYIFIKQDLKEKGWDIRNPARHPSGEVYTKNEV